MKRLIKLFYIYLAFVVAGCSDILDLEDPNRYTEESYFVDLDRTEESVNAIYSALRHDGLFVRNYPLMFDFLGNEGEGGFGDSFSEFADFSFNPSNQAVNGYWASLYRIILRANFSEYVINQLNGVQEERKNIQLGQVHFLRAWAYFELVTAFGRVPLRTELEDREIIDMPRSEIAEVWEYVEQELNAAAEFLPVSYDAANTGRVTRKAALGLLGKSLVFQEKYSEAIQVFDQLAALNVGLAPNYTDNFTSQNENNIESLFEVQFFDNPAGFSWYMFNGPANGGLYEDPGSSGSTHTGRHKEYSWTTWFNARVPYAIGEQFAYEDESGNLIVDPRASEIFYGREGIGDSTYCDNCLSYDATIYPRSVGAPDTEVDWGPYGYAYKKYCLLEDIPNQAEPRSDINMRVLRYADILLLDAEAHIFTNQLEAARQLINRVRSRAGVFNYSTLGNQEEAFEKLKKERLLELLGEQHRWRDLVRWGIAAETINREKGAEIFLQIHNKLPIPSNERQTNKAIVDDVNNDWN